MRPKLYSNLTKNDCTKFKVSQPVYPHRCVKNDKMTNMALNNDIFNDINLYITTEKFYAEPRGGTGLLVIDRVTEEITSEQNTGQVPEACSRRSICGIIGSIRLISGCYLIVATHRIPVGTIAGHTIWKLAGADLLPYVKATIHLTDEQISDNEEYLKMLHLMLNTPNLYFSYSYDLTHTLQRLHNTSPEFMQLSIIERADRRFIWNGELLSCFKKQNLHRYCLPLLHGFISINTCSINGQCFNFTIVSRRSVYRAGTRFFRRGVNEHGQVANFVETEQIVEYEGDRASFVQTRGSIPLFWEQYPDIRYKPPPTLSPLENHILACSKHFEDQVLNYGRQVCVNLIDHHGSEQVLETAFRNTLAQINNPNVRYEAFDFHAECRKMRWDRLSVLLLRLAHEQDEFSWFLLTRDGTLASIQDGVFRTNCMDCLDRTNVVQSMLAKRNLNGVLLKLCILKNGQTIDDHPGFEMLFKAVWSDNADIVSIQYSGTGALKTDFTRTGKRTRMGLVKDGVNSLTRYYKNNFRDGFRQDSIDLFLGNYFVQEGEGSSRPCPLRVDRGWKYVTFPSVLLIAVAMFVACGILPSEYSTETLIYMLFWGSMVMSTGILILRHGKEFVDKPKLT
ncbi:phosphatidylinositol-3-phosphatase SAC1 [Chrysoperla carnea]|uniref:phosphatidylinositol-3-phosphatase SAC1 n=1 Tax=Chrysoperla carnea TaxID=189513 RepID=UPI001D09433C|nr:phosphatidylinositol-3-phosphatase SAC1 [Chrysoperla carnea]